MKLFYERKIFVATFAPLILTFFNSALAQLRFDALILKPKEIYKITESDILVVDSLVMGEGGKGGNGGNGTGGTRICRGGDAGNGGNGGDGAKDTPTNLNPAYPRCLCYHSNH